jgi:hypothetical protein
MPAQIMRILHVLLPTALHQHWSKVSDKNLQQHIIIKSLSAKNIKKATKIYSTFRPVFAFISGISLLSVEQTFKIIQNPFNPDAPVPINYRET